MLLTWFLCAIGVRQAYRPRPACKQMHVVFAILEGSHRPSRPFAGSHGPTAGGVPGRVSDPGGAASSFLRPIQHCSLRNTAAQNVERRHRLLPQRPHRRRRRQARRQRAARRERQPDREWWLPLRTLTTTPHTRSRLVTWAQTSIVHSRSRLVYSSRWRQRRMCSGSSRATTSQSSVQNSTVRSSS